MIILFNNINKIFIHEKYTIHIYFENIIQNIHYFMMVINEEKCFSLPDGVVTASTNRGSMGHANLPYLEPLAVLGQNKLGTGPDFMPQDKSLAMQTNTFINTSLTV